MNDEGINAARLERGNLHAVHGAFSYGIWRGGLGIESLRHFGVPVGIGCLGFHDRVAAAATNQEQGNKKRCRQLDVSAPLNIFHPIHFVLPFRGS